MSSDKDFQGIYVALATPMTPESELNEDALRQLLDFNIDSGVDGFWIAGGGGESVLLDDDENRRIAEISAEQVAGRAKIIMHVGAPTTKRAASMAEHASKVGVDAICCVPPFFYGQPKEAIAEHYRSVSESAGLPFFAYNLPSSTGVEITPDMMALFQERVPRMEGLKHSAFNFLYVREFVRMGLSCFIGFSALTLPALSMGAVGTVDGPPGIAPEFWVELWQAFKDGDMDRALAAQDKGIEVCNLIWKGDIGGYHPVLKAAITHRTGIDCGAPRAPGQPLSLEKDALLKKQLAEMGLLKST
ncbi:uncharacterized protein METZ01_LOCUS284907 [marine metagenome]|uniref:Dihydrodipicolinate synthase family protein n=1 Tax=marine metagenome TaxID=408172 RepID=A0A382L7W9_9ZZZZ